MATVLSNSRSNTQQQQQSKRDFENHSKDVLGICRHRYCCVCFIHGSYIETMAELVEGERRSFLQCYAIVCSFPQPKIISGLGLIKFWRIRAGILHGHATSFSIRLEDDDEKEWLQLKPIVFYVGRCFIHLNLTFLLSIVGGEGSLGICCCFPRKS